LVVDRKCKSELRIAYSDFLVYNEQNNSPLMHHKFAIFKDNINHKSLVSNGSFNFTDNANEENIMIFDNSILIEEFKKQFDRLKNKPK
jgi:phosphatidylserine/phosphatidylglycerophosphate/cardiolipin synthase-like enzyme